MPIPCSAACSTRDAAVTGRSVRKGEFTVTRAYLPDTNILRTEFRTPSGGRVAVTDCMPVGRTLDARTHDYVDLNAPGWITRRVEGLEGEVTLAVEYRPSLEFAREAVTLSLAEGRGGDVGGRGRRCTGTSTSASRATRPGRA